MKYLNKLKAWFPKTKTEIVELTLAPKENSDTKHYYLNGELHRTTVVETIYGNKYWYLNGKLHRIDGPACEYPDGTKQYYLNGKLHRENGPAIEYANGDKSWYLNDKLHRTNGPAIERDGNKHWFLNGELHRIDGPAIENKDGSKEYWLNGQKLTEKTMKKVIRYPIEIEIIKPDNKIALIDAEGVYIIFGNNELSLNQWQFIVNILNEAAKNGKFIPEK